MSDTQGFTSAPMPEATCNTCPFYFALRRECRRHPPKVQLYAQEKVNEITGKVEPVAPVQPTSYFPPQRPESWCGEHPLRSSGQVISTQELPELDLSKGVV